MSEFEKWHRPARFTDVSLGIRDAEVCLTCHTVLDEPGDWPEDGPEWAYPNVQVPWPCVAYREVERLRAIEARGREYMTHTQYEDPYALNVVATILDGLN